MVFVVAEIGVNWNGNIDLAKDMILNAKKAGCNAVKFQSFNEEIVANHPAKESLLKCSISRSNIEKIDQLSRNIGIEWFCTPMYSEAVDFLEPYVNRYKIREFDGRLLLENKTSEIIQKILDTGKEIIVSSHVSPRNSKYFKNKQIKWLYCVPKYPCKLKELDFSRLSDFEGYSNHSVESIASISAAILGAKIIEIHVTSNKKGNFIDNNVSLDFTELKETINQIRLSEEIKK